MIGGVRDRGMAFEYRCSTFGIFVEHKTCSTKMNRVEHRAAGGHDPAAIWQPNRHTSFDNGRKVSRTLDPGTQRDVMDSNRQKPLQRKSAHEDGCMMDKIFLALVAMLAMLGTAIAQGNYLIKSGDTLSIEILEDDSLNRQVLVLPDGNVSFPMAGTVRARGLTTEQVERSIASRVSSNFAVTPTIYVSVANTAPLEPRVEEPDAPLLVYLVGEVNEPGPKEIEPGTTFLQLLSQSGGFTKFAATKRLQLRRTDANGQQRLYKINYKAISQGAQMSRDLALYPGDVILVPERRLFE